MVVQGNENNLARLPIAFLKKLFYPVFQILDLDFALNLYYNTIRKVLFTAQNSKDKRIQSNLS